MVFGASISSGLVQHICIPFSVFSQFSIICCLRLNFAYSFLRTFYFLFIFLCDLICEFSLSSAIPAFLKNNNQTKTIMFFLGVIFKLPKNQPPQFNTSLGMYMGENKFCLYTHGFGIAASSLLVLFGFFSVVPAV